MKQHLNTLFVTTQGAYLFKKGEAVVVRIEKEDRLRIPLINLGAIACFGRVSCSPPLLGACGERGIGVSFLTERGRFLAAVNGFTPGNVLLRREQYRRADDLEASAEIARSCIAGKLTNSRIALRRAARESRDESSRLVLSQRADRIDHVLQWISDPTPLDVLRGLEGECGSDYFMAFDHMIAAQKDSFRFTQRSRRPPLDPVNALLSFLYSMLALDARSACEASGLDAAVGFLHRDRPGRPSLALDLMEELRPILADRVALSLINRQQVKVRGFDVEPTGGVRMDDETRRTVISAYQKRKQETITHPFLNEKMSLGLVVHIQARLLARHLRGDLDAYPPFLWK